MYLKKYCHLGILIVNVSIHLIAEDRNATSSKRSFSFLKTNKSIEQHVAQLYHEKPYLQHYQLQHSLPPLPSTDMHTTLKQYLSWLSKGIDISMFLYCAYIIYNKHSEIYAENADLTKNRTLQSKILQYIPKHIINAPKHTCFFFDSLEVILKAFIIKVIVKLLIFLVNVG